MSFSALCEAATQDNAVIAAVNRCATQNPRTTSIAAEADSKQCSYRSPLRHPKLRTTSIFRKLVSRDWKMTGA
jgi:hypothetical protein